MNTIISKFTFALSLAVLMLTPLSGHAQYSGLKDVVVSEFTKEDHALLKSALNAALQGTEAPSAQQWENKASGAFGSVTAGKPFTHEGRNCRKVRFVNNAKGQKGSSKFTYCQIEDGTWKVLD